MEMRVPLETLSVGCRAPDFTLAGADGGPLRLYGLFAGRPLLLLFWPGPAWPQATAALVEITRQQPDFEAVGCDLLLVAATSDGGEGDLEAPFPLCFDADGTVTQAYLAAGGLADDKTDALTALLLDANQRVLWLGRGESLAGAGLARLETLRPEAGEAALEVVSCPAPVMILPRVFDEAFCAELIRLWREGSPEEGTVGSADEAGEFHRVYHERKKRLDLKVQDMGLHRDLERALGQRIAPELEKAFGFANFHFERFLIGCYDAQRSDFFRPHRDNLSEDTATRRFAVSVNLNEGYEGGEVVFPEYGPDRYCPEAGGALIFSCSLIHEALPVTRGERFVLLNMCRQNLPDEGPKERPKVR